jgi:hypothetical protein
VWVSKCGLASVVGKCGLASVVWQDKWDLSDGRSIDSAFLFSWPPANLREVSEGFHTTTNSRGDLRHDSVLVSKVARGGGGGKGVLTPFLLALLTEPFAPTRRNAKQLGTTISCSATHRCLYNSSGVDINTRKRPLYSVLLRIQPAKYSCCLFFTMWCRRKRVYENPYVRRCGTFGLITADSWYLLEGNS